MALKRAWVVLALSIVSFVAACGGGGGASVAPGTSPTPAATEAATPAATEAATEAATPAVTEAAAPSVAPPPAGGPGTLTVTVGDRTVSTRITCQGDPESYLVLMPAGDSSDTVAVILSSTGLTTAAGTISGVDFGVMPGGTVSIDGKSATFSGTDAGTELAVSGSFTCP